MLIVILPSTFAICTLLETKYRIIVCVRFKLSFPAVEEAGWSLDDDDDDGNDDDAACNCSSSFAVITMTGSDGL